MNRLAPRKGAPSCITGSGTELGVGGRETNRAPAYDLMGEARMSQTAQASINAFTQYRPKCSKCGAAMALARIVPGDDAEHDQRTFECTACGNTEIVTVKFR